MGIYNKKNAEFATVYSDYYPVVFGTLYSKVRDIGLCDDLTQEVFIRYFSKMEEVEKTRSWLLGTLKNILMEYYRKNRNIPENVPVEDVFEDVSLMYVNGFRDTRIIINEAIESIEDRTDRMLFDLITIQHFTYQESAELLGLRRGQVRYRHEMVVKYIIDYLHKRGIEKLEDIL